MEFQQPFEILIHWALRLPFNDLLNLSATCRHFNEVIGQNDLFWRLKFEDRFKLKDSSDRPWREKYRTYGRLHIYNSQGTAHQLLLSLSGTPIRAKQVSGMLFLNFEGQVWSANPLLSTNYQLVHSQIQKICTTASTEYLLTQSGEVLYRGIDVNTREKIEDWKRIKFPIKLVDIAAGIDHLIGLDVNGKIWGWGQNTFQHLGENDEALTIPVQVTDFTAKKIIAGDYISAFITLNDELWIGGISRSGEIGPRLVQGFYYVHTKVKDVGFTSQDMFILTLDNNFKQLGNTKFTVKNNNRFLPNRHNYSIFFDSEFVVLVDNMGKIHYSKGINMTKQVLAMQITRYQETFIILEQ